MSKTNKPGASPAPGRALESVQRSLALVRAHPDSLSYDPTLKENEILHIRCMTDPGIAGPQRDGWRGVMVGWAVTPWEITDEETGELLELPSAVLIARDGAIVRLTGWPAVSALSALVHAAGADRCREGLPVVVSRRASGTAGRSYWTVQIDPRA